MVLEAHRVPKSSRPEVIRRVLEFGNSIEALYAAEEVERRRAIQRLTGSQFAPGAKLHVLTVGVSEYGANAAALRLDYADDDARDLHAALAAQSADLWPYQPGFSMTLQNGEAKKETILRQLENMAERMSRSPGASDLAVVHFSGHGMVLDDEFFLLPHDARLRPKSAVWDSAISGTRLQRAIQAMARHGRVLLLLDACRSGAVGPDGAQAVLDADLLRARLSMGRVTVLTSSRAGQSSWEHDDWRNGAFTETVLEALGDPADANGNGMVSMNELVGHVTGQVLALTKGRAASGGGNAIWRRDVRKPVLGENDMRNFVFGTVMVALGSGVSAQGMDWVEASGALQEARYQAEECGRVLKRYVPAGDRDALTLAEITYEGARAEMMSVIARLDMALVVDSEETALATLEERLGTANTMLVGMCEFAADQLPDTSGERSVLEAVIGAVGVLVEAGVSIWQTLFEARREDEALRIANIRTALEDAKWKSFEDL